MAREAPTALPMTPWAQDADTVLAALASRREGLVSAEAERRQLTVMFYDLVGSTALSTGMDPEDLRDVIASYQSRCSAAIRRYDGFVAKYMGDGILAYFGYPRAHENSAERAILAGDPETGVALMRLTPGMDEGPVPADEVARIGAQIASRTQVTGMIALLRFGASSAFIPFKLWPHTRTAASAGKSAFTP